MTNILSTIQKRIMQNIKLYRENAGISQVQLGLKAGLSENYVCKIEIGKSAPSIKALCKIADALGIDPIELFKKD